MVASVYVLNKGMYTVFLLDLHGVGMDSWRLLFNLAHYLLAHKYQNMARRVPALLNGQQPLAESACQTATFWILVFNNVVSGALYGYCLCAFYIQLTITKVYPNQALVVTKIITTYWVALCAIISGVMLVEGVHRIRKFFKN